MILLNLHQNYNGNTMKKFFWIMICSFGFTACFATIQESPHVQDVLEYWFGSLSTADVYPTEKASLWFNGGEGVDNDIRNRFGKLVIAATHNELNTWKDTAKGRLALIILVDQFTRNIYRGNSQAFAYDTIAQDLTLEGLILGHDQSLLPIERVFFYLPLEHAENFELQKLAVEKFHAILSNVPSQQLSHFKNFENYAWRHYDIIEKFGRFPHRNMILNRTSTSQEIEFLKDPHASF